MLQNCHPMWRWRTRKKPSRKAPCNSWTALATRRLKQMRQTFLTLHSPLSRKKTLTTDTGRDGGFRVLTCYCSLAMKLAAAHQAIGNIGCLQQGALGRKVSRQIPRGGD